MTHLLLNSNFINNLALRSSKLYNFLVFVILKSSFVRHYISPTEISLDVGTIDVLVPVIFWKKGMVVRRPKEWTSPAQNLRTDK